jgi:hypothetical protein
VTLCTKTMLHPIHALHYLFVCSERPGVEPLDTRRTDGPGELYRQIGRDRQTVNPAKEGDRPEQAIIRITEAKESRKR